MSVKLKKGGVRIDSDSKTRRDRSEIDGVELDSAEVKDDEVGKKVQKTFKSKNLS